MPEDTPQLYQSFRPGHWYIGDPAIILDTIMNQVEAEQAKQITMLYLDSVAAGLEANLKFIQGVRSVVAGAAARR